jgi:hypothetical protein
LDIGSFGKNRNLTWGKALNVWSQHFNLKGNHVQNERGLVLDVAGGRDLNNQTVVVWRKHRGINQRWRVEYV